MAKEEETTEIQSSVQYKRFDDDADVDDESTIGNGTTRIPETRPSPPEDSSSEQNDNSREQTGQQNNAAQTGNDANTPGKEVVLQMNGNLDRTEPVQEPVWNWLNLVLSIASIFCCSVCGILATVTSVLAYVDHRVGDFDSSHRKRVASYALALAGLIVGLICMGIVVIVALHIH